MENRLPNSTVYADITLIISSCGRFDLLFDTLDSMQFWLKYIPQKIIVEDSGSPQNIPFKRLEAAGFTILVNSKQLGQHRSLDRAYALVENKYIFHCEDDWKFLMEPDFLFAKDVINNYKVSCFLFRKNGDRAHATNPEKEISFSHHETYTFKDKQFKMFSISNTWVGYSFTPHLALKELYNIIGDFTRYPAEENISEHLKEKSFTVAAHPHGYCIHNGWGRHVNDPTQLPVTYNIWRRLRRSLRKRWRRIKST